MALKRFDKSNSIFSWEMISEDTTAVATADRSATTERGVVKTTDYQGGATYGFEESRGYGGLSYFIQGGDGNDQIFGGPNDDILKGGGGLDQLYGEGGNDDLYGGEHTDWILGGDGWDQLARTSSMGTTAMTSFMAANRLTGSTAEAGTISSSEGRMATG
jgi:Ca2+-binding RTX toxin-like protein